MTVNVDQTRWRIVHLRILGWLLPLILALTACAGQPERLWLNAPGWSRAQRVGRTRATDPVPIALDDAGHTYLFLTGADDGASHPRVIALDRSADVVLDRTIEEIELISSQKPSLLWDGKAFQLFWLSRQRLYNAQVDTTGSLSNPPVLLSAETTVGDYDVARDAGGSMTIWYAGTRQEPGLYALPTGKLTGEATLVDADGVRPDLQYDDAGTLHAIWAHYPPGPGDKPFFYAAYPGGVYRPGQATMVVKPRLSGTTVLQGPHLGLDRQNAYILWSTTFYTGPQAGTAETDYVYFPKNQPASVSSVRQLHVPYLYDLPYRALPGGELKAGPRVPLGSEFRGGGTFITDVATDPVPEQELAIAFHVRLAYRMRQEQPQIGTVFFRGGIPTSYQLLTFTPANSTAPALLSDEAGWLYIAWLERGDPPGRNVYFASTAPEIQQALAGITPDDAGRVSAETLFGILAGALLLPFALVWIIVPVIVISLASLIRGDDERWTSFGTIASLSAAFIAYWAGKLAFLPGMLDYVPFSAWLPVIPSWLEAPLRIGVPLLIAGLALAAARYYIRSRDSRSAFVFMLIYCVVDSILTMAVYGVLVYAAF